MDVWDQSAKTLRARIRRIAGHAAPLDDLMQDLFVKVYGKAHRLERDFADRYLMTAAANLARDYLRSYRRVSELPELQAKPTQFDACHARERRDLYSTQIQPLLTDLPRRSRQAIEALQSERPRNHLARDLGVPPSTLRSREQAAVKRLQDGLGYRQNKPNGQYHR